MPIKDINEALRDQVANFKSKSSGTLREVSIEEYLLSPQIIVITGTRRVGKSTLLRQFAESLKNYYYLNLDDERFVGMEVQEFADIMLIWQKMYQSKYILLDEVQNIKDWERFVRRVHDEGYKVILTGSNAHLLSSELSTHLTGRYKSIELFPFSFSEYLNHFKINPILTPTTSEKAKILKAFDSFREWGSFPHYCNYQDKDFLKTLYDNILYKDVLFRYTIREKKSFRELSQFMFTNYSREINYMKLKNLLGFKSQTSVKNYISYLEEAYLIFQLYKYDFSLKKQYTSNKKIYIIDNGIANTIGFSFSQNKGQLLENLVFIELKRRAYSIYYHKDKNECDFIVKQKQKITMAFQVTENISTENEKREVDGLLEAMEYYKLNQGKILTYNQEKIIKIGKKIIEILPIWKWFLATEKK